MATPARIHSDLKLVHAIRGVLSFSESSQEIGVIPSGSVILGVFGDVTTAFNAATTNVVKVGTAATEDLLVDANDFTEGTAGSYVKWNGQVVAADTTISGFYSQTGTAATAGEIDITVLYYPHST